METGTDNSTGAKKDKSSSYRSVGANVESGIKGNEKEIETTDDEIVNVDAVEETTACKNTKIDEHSLTGNTTAHSESEYERKGKLEATEHDSAKGRNKNHHSATNDTVSDSETKRRVKQRIGDKKNEEPEIEEISDDNEESKNRHRPGRNQVGTDEIEIEAAEPEPKKRHKKKKKKKGKPKVKVNIHRIAQEVDFSSEDEQAKPSEAIVHEAVVHHHATSFYEPILKETDLYSE